MKTLLISTFAALMLLAGPVSAGERGGPPGGGGCPGGGCGGGGHPGGGGGHPGHGGGNTHVNVNVNASASASTRSYAGGGAVINARGYDVGVVRGGGGFGGAVVSGSGYGGWDSLGHGGGAAAVVVSGPGYGPSRPFGYTVGGFGRHYVTTDRCGSCGAPPPPPPPPSCYDRCDGHDYGLGGGDRYSDRRDRGDHGRGDCGCDRCGCDGPRYTPHPYAAAPLEPVHPAPPIHVAPPRIYVERPQVQVNPSQVIVEPPQVYFSDCTDGPACTPITPYAPSTPAYGQAPSGYYGDLPPGDDGVSLPYRQEPGERG